MSADDFDKLRDRVRAEVAAPLHEVDALIAGTGTGTPAPEAHEDAPSFDERY